MPWRETMPPSSSMLWAITSRSATIWIDVRNGSSLPSSSRWAKFGSMIADSTLLPSGSAIVTSCEVSVSRPLPPSASS